MKRAIEEDFPIVEINRLAVPERNSFKPIYQMHKWFARRASCVFRAILLGALKLLPMHAYGLQAYAPGCDPGNDPDKCGGQHSDLFGGNGETEETEKDDDTGQADAAYSGPFVPPTHNLVWKQSGK